MLFLPETELHEIGLLFYHYIARKAGVKTFYLGQAVPHEELKTVCQVHNPHLLITSITSSPPVSVSNAYLQQLSSDFPGMTILASGAVMRKSSFRFPANLRFFESATDLRSIFHKLKGNPKAV